MTAHSEMILRVARAMWFDRFPTIPWETATEMSRQDWLGHAKAAIEAMREPTDDMISAAEKGEGYHHDSGERHWSRMIRAALGVSDDKA